MLTELREKSQGFMILVLFGMLIFVFIFFFGPQAEGFRPGGSQQVITGEAATVRGQKVDMKEVDTLVRRSPSANDLKPEEMGSVRRQSALQLVDQVILEQRARKMGLAVSKDEVSRYVTSKDNPDFGYFIDHTQTFDYKRYESQVTQWFGLTTDQYREMKERELLVNRYLEFLMSQVKISGSEVRAAFDRNTRSWNLEYVKFSASDFPAAAAPTAEAGAQWAKDHADAVQAYYDDNKKNYDRDKEVRVRRILVRVAKDADDAAKKAAREKIDGLLAQAKAEGADFAALAKASSEGYYKTYGGDMGWQSKQNTSAPDYALFSGLEKGQLSEVRTSPIGLWFVKAEDVKPAVKKSLDAVRDEIGLILAKQEGEKALARKAAEAVLAAVKGGASLADAAAAEHARLNPPAAPEQPAAPDAPEEGEPARPDEEKKPEEKAPELVKTTGAFTANRPAWDTVPGIGKAPDLVEQLDGLTEEAPLVDTVIEAGPAYFVVALKERKEPTDEDFAKEEQRFTTQLKAARAAQLFGNWRAVVFGPVAQREVFRKFAGGALLDSLPAVDGDAIALNASKFPTAPASAAAASKPAAKP